MKPKPSTIAADGEHIDCYIGPDENAQYVYIIHQHIDGQYDEDKACLNFSSADDAKQCFLDHAPAEFFHSMTILPVEEFVAKVKGSRDNPGKIHAAELTRAIAPHEKHHDFDGHAERQDKTQTAIRRILAGAKPELFREAARRAAQFEPTTLDSLSMPFDRSLAARVARSAGIAHKYGHSQVYAERYRATGKPKHEKAKLSTPAAEMAKKSSEQDRPALIAEAAVSDLNNWITARARGAHVDAYKKGLRADDLEGAILDDLEEGSDGMLDRIAMEAARGAVAGGRYSAFQELDNEIDRYVRSEAMDQNTCDSCAEGDGDEWDSLDDVDWSPGDDCEGGDNCRGQLMPIFSDEGTVETLSEITALGTSVAKLCETVVTLAAQERKPVVDEAPKVGVMRDGQFCEIMDAQKTTFAELGVALSEQLLSAFATTAHTSLVEQTKTLNGTISQFTAVMKIAMAEQRNELMSGNTENLRAFEQFSERLTVGLSEIAAQATTRSSDDRAHFETGRKEIAAGFENLLKALKTRPRLSEADSQRLSTLEHHHSVVLSSLDELIKAVKRPKRVTKTVKRDRSGRIAGVEQSEE